MKQMLVKILNWIKEHHACWYVMFFLTYTYLLTTYESSIISWYNDNVMSILEMFMPSIWSFIIAIVMIIFVIYDIIEKVQHKYQYDSKIMSLSIVFIVTIIRYRFSGLYTYVSWLWFVSYVDVFVLLLLAYVIAYGLGRCQSYCFGENRKKNEENVNSTTTLLRDWPIMDKSEDILNLHEEAKRIAFEIEKLNKKKTWSLAITAPWGTGKTSFLNLVVKELNKNVFDIIYFNPRDSKSYQFIQKDFFNCLACTLAKYNSRCNSVIKNYMAALQLIDNRGMIEKLLNFYKIWDKEGLKGNIKATFSVLHKNVLVLIDDFDRLSKDEIMEVLKLIDSNAAFNKLVFLTAYDKEQVNRVLGSQYQTKDACFVDKFFNLEYTIPSRPYWYISRYIEKELIRILDANEDEKQSIRGSMNSSNDIYKSYLPTLRDTKRFINHVVLDFGNVRGEVNLNEFMLLHLIKYKYPDRYMEVHRFKYMKRGECNKRIIHLKDNVNEELDIYPILIKLFPLKDSLEKEDNCYRHIYESNSFEYYFANQILDSIKKADMLQLFNEGFDKACIKIDLWIASEKKCSNIIEFMGSYNLNSLTEVAAFIRYTKVLAYLATKIPTTQVYWLFLDVVNMKKIEDYKTKYNLNVDNYKKELIDIIINPLNNPDYSLLQQMHVAFKTLYLNEKDYLVKDTDIWSTLKNAFFRRLNELSVCETTMRFLYNCIDHMEELPSRLLLLDKDCLKAMKKEIKKSPSFYINTFVRLGGMSSNPDYNSIACEPFWEQIFGNSSAMDDFINKSHSEKIGESNVAYNFWQLYKANNNNPIEFYNEGNVMDKIKNGLVDEVKMLEDIQLIKSDVDKIPSDFKNYNSNDKAKYKKQLYGLLNKLEGIRLYIALNVSVHKDIERRLSKLP